VVKTVPREGLWLVQTPQAFRREAILAAYERAAADGFYGTDDASLVERTGTPVRMISGDADNIKVTTPEDLERGERIIRRFAGGTAD
jgi:2-C-methyl-D-erythritol 4-phosphate cytidylyltransferase